MLAAAKGTLARAFVGTLAKNNDRKTTILGIVAGAVIGAVGIDWTKLAAGDPGQIGIVAGAIVAALFGYYTNKPDKEKTA